MKPLIRAIVVVASDHIAIAYVMAQAILLVIAALFIVVVAINSDIGRVGVLAISSRDGFGPVFKTDFFIPAQTFCL